MAEPNPLLPPAPGGKHASTEKIANSGQFEPPRGSSRLYRDPGARPSTAQAPPVAFQGGTGAGEPDPDGTRRLPSRQASHPGIAVSKRSQEGNLYDER